MLTTSSNKLRHRRAVDDRHAGGFTLMEMLVVIAIMAVVIVIGSGTVRDSPGLRAHAAALELAFDLGALRRTAMSVHATTTLVLDPGGYTASPCGLTRRLAPGVSIALISSESDLFGRSQTAVQCYSDGSCTGGTFMVQDQTARVQVQLQWLDGGVVVHGP